MSTNQAGKGDKPRPVNKTRYVQNYEAINWTQKNIQPKEVKKVKSRIIYKY